MPTLSDYGEFGGRHWETGSVRNFLAYCGVTAPHNGEPFSEAFLLGVSGGITVGYFTFAYEGYDPQCNILTRNTFDPLDTMLSRLGIVQRLEHTRSPQRAVSLLADTLADGVPAILWADMYSLPYNALPEDAGMWASFPLVIFGYEADEDRVAIADRARVPLAVTTADLAAARGRIKKDKFRLLTLEPPNPDKLASAAALGIGDTVRLFTEKPPKGSPKNFGLRALEHWAQMLAEPRQRQSWAKQFPPGIPLYAGLTSAYQFAFLFGKGSAQDAERGLYARFLDEAALLLARPALRAAADGFRASARLWQTLPAALLPDEVGPLGEARRLMWRRHEAFLERGGAALAEMKQIDAQLQEVRAAAGETLLPGQVDVQALCDGVAATLRQIRAAEGDAVAALRAAMV